MSYEIYADGSCLGNPGPGGWAAIIRTPDGDKTIKGGTTHTTNNKMELYAILAALAEIEPSQGKKAKVKIFSDSNYCVRAINEWLYNWKKVNFKGKKNADMWKIYLELVDGFDVNAIWVKAHNGHPENELVDSLAYQEAKKRRKGL